MGARWWRSKRPSLLPTTLMYKYILFFNSHYLLPSNQTFAAAAILQVQLSSQYDREGNKYVGWIMDAPYKKYVLCALSVTCI